MTLDQASGVNGPRSVKSGQPSASILRPAQRTIATGRTTCCHAAISLPSDLPACAGCGRCCHLVVELRPGDCVPEELIAIHDGERCMDQRGDGACVALDPATLLCSIYASRPQTCRDFARGGTLCRQILIR